MQIVIPPFLRGIYNNKHFSHPIFSPNMVAGNQKYAYQQLHVDGPLESAYRTPSATETTIASGLSNSLPYSIWDTPGNFHYTTYIVWRSGQTLEFSIHTLKEHPELPL